ncbi:MAG: hypothetical protein ABL912_14330 [Novosphingobium sp.]
MFEPIVCLVMGVSLATMSVVALILGMYGAFFLSAPLAMVQFVWTAHLLSERMVA